MDALAGLGIDDGDDLQAVDPVALDCLPDDDLCGVITRRIGQRWARGAQGAWQHAARMRFKKLKRTKGRVSRWVQKRLDWVNTEVATRPCDQIHDVAQAKPQHVSGRGNYKRWTPEAYVRACFGVLGSALASTRAVALTFKAGHSYVQEVRDAVAAYIFNRQKSAFTSCEAAHTSVIKVAFDETEFQVKIQGETSVQNFMMIHAESLRRHGQLRRKQELVVPPGILADQSAASICTALHQRLLGHLGSYASCSNQAYVLVSDSAAACLKVAVHFAEGANVNGSTPTLHSRCMMHMMFLAVVHCLGLYEVVTPMFCATVLMHKGHTMRLVKREMRKLVSQRLKVVYSPPANHERHNSAVLRLLECADIYFEGHRGQSLGDEEGKTKRRAARRSLLKMLPGKWAEDGEFIHYCPAACGCTSRKAAVDTICDLIELSYLDTRPAVPALNRWNTLYGPLAWWSFGTLLFGLLTDAFLAIRMNESVEDAFLRDIDFAGPGTENTYRLKMAIRWKKAAKWLQDSTCRKNLHVATLLFNATLPLLAKFFHETRAKGSVIPFCEKSTNPAAQTMGLVARLLGDPANNHWISLGSWEDASLVRRVAVGAFSLLGGLYMRCVQPFDEWPWPLARAVHPTAGQGAKAQVFESLSSVRACCVPHADGFTLPFKLKRASADGHLIDQACIYLEDVFSMTPCNNIGCEDRFARCRRHNDSLLGSGSSASTLASFHALAEWKAIYASAKKGRGPQRLVLAAAFSIDPAFAGCRLPAM